MAMFNSYVELPEGNFPRLSYWPVDPWIILNLRKDTIKISTNQGNWKPINGKLKGCLSLHIEARICLVQLLNASALHGIEKSSKSWPHHGRRDPDRHHDIFHGESPNLRLPRGSSHWTNSHLVGLSHVSSHPRGFAGLLPGVHPLNEDLMATLGVSWPNISWIKENIPLKSGLK